MVIPGALERTTLGDVLGALHRARATGWLEIAERIARPAWVFLRAGDPTFVVAEGVRLGEVLGLHFPFAPREPELLGESLVRAGAIAPDQVREGLREQTRRRLSKLFQIRSARLRFRPATAFDMDPRANAKAALAAPSLAPEEYLHGRPRARDAASGGAPDVPPEVRLALFELGLTRVPTNDELRQVFRVLAREIHPDGARDPEDRDHREKRLARLSAAYHTLLSAR